MTKMGYTERRSDGVAFPDGAEPDYLAVLNLVVDLYVGRKEVEMFLEDQHPYPHTIEESMSPEFRFVINFPLVHFK